jgi:carbon storage regulator
MSGNPTGPEVHGAFATKERPRLLVLTRRSEESIVIGGNIVITVLGVEGEKVKIGIDAPREVQILRKELFDAVQEQNKLAEKLSGIPEPPSFRGLREMLAKEARPDREAGEDPKK